MRAQKSALIAVTYEMNQPMRLMFFGLRPYWMDDICLGESLGPEVFELSILTVIVNWTLGWLRKCIAVDINEAYATLLPKATLDSSYDK